MRAGRRGAVRPPTANPVRRPPEDISGKKKSRVRCLPCQIVALVAPPSSRMFWPTMNPAWTEQRKAQAAPNSAEVP